MITDHIPVLARVTDPDTSKEAASALEADQPRLARSIQTVVAILTVHNAPMSDFAIRAAWHLHWNGPFSFTLPSKARLWAMQAGKVRQAGYGQHNGRRVMLWELGTSTTPPKQTAKQRIAELEDENARLRALVEAYQRQEQPELFRP